MKTKRLSVRVHEDDYELFKAYADSRDRSVSELINDYIKSVRRTLQSQESGDAEGTIEDLDE